MKTQHNTSPEPTLLRRLFMKFRKSNQSSRLSWKNHKNNLQPFLEKVGRFPAPYEMDYLVQWVTQGVAETAFSSRESTIHERVTPHRGLYLVGNPQLARLPSFPTTTWESYQESGVTVTWKSDTRISPGANTDSPAPCSGDTADVSSTNSACHADDYPGKRYRHFLRPSTENNT
jgi:hypothetical protein